MIQNICKPSALGIYIIIFFAACSPTLKMARTGVVMPQNYYSSDSLDRDTLNNIASISYREFFKDQKLISLIDSGLSRNNNMLIAVKQIEIAQEAMKQVKRGYLPIVDLTLGNASLNRPSGNSFNGIMARQYQGKAFTQDYTTSLNISWEADIWGKIKAQNAAALTNYLETSEAAVAVKTGLVSEIANGYYRLLVYDQQRKISLENLSLGDSTLRMSRLQMKFGLINSLSIKQLENSRDKIARSIRIIEENIRLQENALNALVGNMPGDGISRGSLTDIKYEEIFRTGVPATLLGRRPDIKQAEFAFMRSVSNRQIAKLNMYPAFRISAQGGLNAFKASNWFSIPGSLFGILSGSITQPLLQQGKLKSAFRQAEIQSNQAELQYKQTVLLAVSEVSGILEQLSSLKDQQIFDVELVARNRKLVDQAKILFQSNMATYLDIIAAQQVKLDSEMDEVSVLGKLLTTEVALYKSLGGGVL